MIFFQISGGALPACPRCHVQLIRKHTAKHIFSCTDQGAPICRNCGKSTSMKDGVKLPKTSCELGEMCCEQPLCINCFFLHKSCSNWGNSFCVICKCESCKLYFLNVDLEAHKVLCKPKVNSDLEGRDEGKNNKYRYHAAVIDYC